MTEANTPESCHCPDQKTTGIYSDPLVNPERWVQDHGDALFGFAVDVFPASPKQDRGNYRASDQPQRPTQPHALQKSHPSLRMTV